MTDYSGELRDNPYPGRGLVIGLTPDGKHAVQVYWIMGRSENSRNRIFVEENGDVKTELFKEDKNADTSLIIYFAMKRWDSAHIVSNGDQTDTVHSYLAASKSFEAALLTRTYEPDAPNFTPRISGIAEVCGGRLRYKLSILKRDEDAVNGMVRSFFEYDGIASGLGHCIHTYAGDGNPIPSFGGKPRLMPIKDDISQTAEFYWDLLNTGNKVSLAVKYIDLADNSCMLKIINKNQR